MVLRALIAVLVVCMSVGISAAEPIEPAGQVLTLPVQTWSSANSNPVKLSAALMLPNALDEAGTLTLVMEANSATNLLAIDRADVPDSLHFLFGDARKICVRTFGQDPWNRTTQTIVTLIPYDQISPAPRTRTLKFLNADEQPLKGFTLRAAFQGQFSLSTASVEFPIGYDGTVVLPILIDPTPRITYPHMQPQPAYDIRLTENSTGQAFTVSLKQQGSTSQTVLLVPTFSGAPPPGIIVADGKVINPDGTPQPNVGVSLSQSYDYRTQSDFMRKDDPSTVTVTQTGPLSDGTFRLAVSPNFGASPASGDVIRASIREQINGLFLVTYAALKKDQTTTIELPRRLTLTARLTDETGTPVDIGARTQGSSWTGIQIKRLNADGSIGDTDSIGLSRDETTASLFTLKNLAVPGRFQIEADNNNYGPVDIGLTSPTQIITFTPTREEGRLRGVVRDERGHPLAGALVAVWTDSPHRDKLAKSDSLASKIASDDKPAALAILNNITTGAVDCMVTTASGQFSFSRTEIRKGGSSPEVLVMAPGRFLGYTYATTSESQTPYSLDVDLPDVKLPAKARATGIVSAPALVPDEEHRGRLKPFPPDQNTYQVFHWSTMSWFPPRPAGSTFWQYDQPTAHFEFGKPFTYDVPAGTSFTLGAMADNLQLSLQLWKHGPVAPGDEIELTSATLRALQPFNLKVVYTDGTPAAGLYVSALYGTKGRMVKGSIVQPVTDENGMWQLYGDEGLAPEITIAKYGGIHRRERFKIQPLDMATSVPTLTLRLDPEIWGTSGGGNQ